MRTRAWLKISVFPVLALAAAAFIWPAHAAMAVGVSPSGPWMQDKDLAEAYAPVLYFHPDEVYRPQPVDVMIGTARLQQALPFWPDARLLLRVTASDLLRYAGGSYYLNAWLGDEPSSDYLSYTAHRAFYESTLSPEAGGPSPTAYAHVVRDEDPAQITIQYWLFYWYNDAFNKHEGDWEMVQVVLTAAGEPEWLVLSQHHGGTRRPWSAAQVEEGTHPAVYVALGSHANYFWGNEVYLTGVTMGNAQVEMADRTGTAGRVVPDVVLTPGRAEVRQDPARWAGFEWLIFSGGWGERAPQRDLSGPLGPADKGDQWVRPYFWGMAQPLDAETWYANRLRVEIVGRGGASPRVSVSAEGLDQRVVDEMPGGIALLHTDPATGTVVLANIQASPGQTYDITATWPDPDTSQVVQYRFEGVPLGAIGHATLSLRADGPALLRVAGTRRGDRNTATGSTMATYRPTARASTAAAWDAPDVIWAIGLLPAAGVLRGVAVSLLAGLLPPLVYVAVLYWVDQYEKEPVRLLAGAFLWGALPALLAAVAVRVFFRLPASVLGPGALRLVSSGLVAPLIEQALVGAAVLFIAWRYRHEFDDVLDGVIYGAVVGLGFAMTANVTSYLGTFVQYGFSGLGHAVLVDGFLYGLNQALYAAIFGAGLGYARLARRRWQRWAVPLASFVLAVVIRAVHNLAIENTVGWNLGTLAVTWAGSLVILAVVLWSLYQERRCLAAELAGEVPDPLYRWLARPCGRWMAEWRALWQGGPRGLVRVRRALQLCAGLAFKKMQSRRLGEPEAAREVPGLRQQVAQSVDGGLLRLLS